MQVKKIVILLLLVVFLSSFACANQYVKGYYKKNGTYVNGYYRTTPDNNPYNNYSTKGNINPYTGKKGTVAPYNSTKSFYNSKSYKK